MQFPEEVLTARFKPHPTCQREVQMEPLDQPVEEALLLGDRLEIAQCCPGDTSVEFSLFARLGIGSLARLVVEPLFDAAEMDLGPLAREAQGGGEAHAARPSDEGGLALETGGHCRTP